MARGRIIKALSGYYYVLDDTENVWQCRARGLFKKQGITPLVGDWVSFDPVENNEGYVIDIYPRKNELVRPPVANIDLAVIVSSVEEPALNLYLLDKILAHSEFAGINSLICFNKTDLKDAMKQSLDEIFKLYTSIGYPVMMTSVKKDEDVNQLKKHLINKTSVFAGQSGVGKSSLLSKMFPDRQIETGHVSNKLGRGRHTTRHVELLPFREGGLVADTPGFSQLDFQEIEKEELGNCFVEIKELSGECKFRGCLHVTEPSCAVIKAKDKGEISESRYKHYVLFLEEINEKKRRY